MPVMCSPEGGSGGTDRADMIEISRRFGACLSRGRLSSLAGILTGTAAGNFLLPAISYAADGSDGVKKVVFSNPIGATDVLQLSIFIGAMGAALFSAAWLIRERGRIAAENLELRARLVRTDTQRVRAVALLDLSEQRVVLWSGDDQKPDLVGKLPEASGAPEDRSRFLAFGRWLVPESAGLIDRRITELREEKKGFDMVVETMSGAKLAVSGRISSAGTMIRFISLFSHQQELASLKLDLDRAARRLAGLHSLLDALPAPVWTRDHEGRLDWVNKAYVAAVEAASLEEVIENQREFLNSQTREAIRRVHSVGQPFQSNASTVISGERHVFAVTDASADECSAGIANDVSNIDQLKTEHERMLRGHAETLDQLTTAVAIFDHSQKLRFFNQAFQELWGMDTQFLESAPENNLVLDRLRTNGKLPEQPEWRKWKDGILQAYRATEPQEDWWHLTDGRTIRVVANPQHNGGVTWVFENMTERFDLESRYNSAVRVQGETLDNLAEGVAVFGPDGKVRLSNPAFRKLWGLDPALVAGGAHISAIRDACAELAHNSPWNRIVSSVTGFDEERNEYSGQTEITNGTVLSYAAVPLPDGQLMTTFVDVTDTVNVERALMERNEALQRADSLKNAFLHHVSYELRSPLTNIIGFTELLLMPQTGPLNTKQNEYLTHIGTSSSLLLNTVNDILDLATVDAGAMELEIADIVVRDTVAAAAEMVSERLREHKIELAIEIGPNIEPFRADELRLRQVLTNLLSNAANFAPEGSKVSITCWRDDAEVLFAVHDDGPGMPEDVLESAFRPFEPHANGGRRRGTGLGLSIVKSFVELHGGRVEIDTGGTKGTTVTCHFPVDPEAFRAAAE
jgi:signal transduction histidine kinase